MHKVTPDEFGIFQGDALVRFTGLFPSGGKSDLLLIGREDTAVRYGDLMCIPAKIFNGIAKPIEGFLNVRTPVLLVKGITKLRPFIRIPQFFTGGRKYQFTAIIKEIQPGKIFSLELIAEDFYRDEKLSFGFAELKVLRKTGARNNTVHMHMVTHFLVPGMK